MVHETSNDHIQAVMNNRKFINLDYLAEKKSGILDWRRDFYDWSINSSSTWKLMPSRHLIKYNTLRDDALHIHTQLTLINRLKPRCSRVPWAWSSSQYAMPVCDVRIISTNNQMLRAIRGRCYRNSIHSLVIVSTLALRLKASEFFLETVATSPLALNVQFTTNGMCAKNNTHIYCMWRELAVIEWSRRVISIVACCHSVKLCALAAQAFRSQQVSGLKNIAAWKSRKIQITRWDKSWLYLELAKIRIKKSEDFYKERR